MMRDLGLTYEQAAHGVQSAIQFEQGQDAFYVNNPASADKAKHLRVGLDMSKADMLGLALLLMDKGVFTQEEYVEYMRRAANEELARYEEHVNTVYGGGVTLTFR
jgi:hypothetical protein